MNFLIIGDIVGRTGMRMLRNNLPNIIEKENIDFCIVNGENAADGKGLRDFEYREITSLGADVVTMGNHIYYRKEMYESYKTIKNLLIPLNVTNLEGNKSYSVMKNNVRIGVINAMGKVGMGELSQETIANPFPAIKSEIGKLKEDKCDYIFIDFHAEATAEKIAMSYYVEEDVTCLFGTHTHVQTADEKILHGKMAYITDVGMTGPNDSVIGLKKEIAVERFLTGAKIRYSCDNGKGQLNGIIVKTDDNTRKPVKISRLNFLEN